MELLTAAGSALATILEPVRFLILLAGIIIGVVVGIIPDVGGLTAIAILIPFTYAMDPYSAFAFLIGLWAVTAMSDVIPAVFFGVPGTIGCAATVLDGHPLIAFFDPTRHEPPMPIYPHRRPVGFPVTASRSSARAPPRAAA